MFMDNHDRMIRDNERNRIRAIEAERKQSISRIKAENFRFAMAGLAQRVIGIAMIALTIIYINSEYSYDIVYNFKDCTFAFLTIPLGIVLLAGNNIYKCMKGNRING